MRGQGSKLFDDEGVEWIDLLSGSFRCPLGLEVPFHQDSILRHHRKLQVDPLQGLSAKSLSDRLTSLGRHPRHWHYATNLDKAVELALMTCLEYRGNNFWRIRAFSGDYHGSSLACGSLFHNFDFYKQPIKIAEVNPYSFKEGKLSDEDCTLGFDAFIFEPIQITTGWGPGYEKIRELQDWCQDTSAFLISNESITSLGRCGHYGFIADDADVVITSLALGHGLPIVAVGFKVGTIDPDFMPECGWPSVNLFCTSVAEDVIDALTISTWQEAVKDLGDTWRGLLSQHLPDEDIRIQGALIHINCKNTNRVEFAKLLKREQFIAASFPPWLALAPAFSTPLSITEEAVERVVRVCKELKGD